MRYLYQAQPDLEVVVCEDDGGDRRRDRRADAARPDQPRPLQDRRDPGRRADRPPRARGRRARDPRLLPVGRHRPVRRDRARRRLRRRRLRQVALRRPGQRLALRPARSLAERLEPTFTGWQAHERPFGFEEEMEYATGAARFLTGTPNVPALYAATAGYDLIEEVGVERIRENSVRQTQLLIDLADAAGFEVRSPREPEPARRHGHRLRPGVPGRPQGAGGAPDPLRLPPRRRHPPRPALLQHRRRAALHGRADRRDRRDRRVRAPPRRGRAALAARCRGSRTSRASPATSRSRARRGRTARARSSATCSPARRAWATSSRWGSSSSTS